MLAGLRLRPRLLLAFGCLLLLQVAAAGFGLLQLHTLHALDEQEARLVEVRAAVSDWNAQTRLNVARALSLAKAGSPPEMARWAEGEMKATTQSISAVQKRVEGYMATAEEKSRMETVAGTRKAYVDMRGELLKRLADPEKKAAAEAEIDSRLLPAAQAYLAALQEVAKAAEAALVDGQQQREAAMQRAKLLLPLIAGLALVLGAVLALLLARSILVPVQQARAVAGAIAGGDLAVDVPAGRSDELGELLASLAAMQDGLRTMVRSIRAGTEEVGGASSQIAAGNQDLSARTERAASNLQETTAAVGGLEESLRGSASQAGQARSLADEAAGVARQGGEVVGQVVRTMDAIQEASGRIADITRVIDGIAFQTNLLALNAAVEAARAGEHGRGFAVVAGEVRGLSTRSADAAREIRGLIEDSVARVQQGAKLAGDAGATMQRIQERVQQVNAAIAGISQAVEGQAGGLGQIHAAVLQLDEITQQNAALVEQAAAAAQSLHGQADGLNRLVSRFRMPARA
jgi:methyl-accepting chemotaxis protein